jgi:hypothetical protein
MQGSKEYAMKRFKFLRLVRGKIKSDSGDQTWKIGEWVHQDGVIKLCKNGLHCSKTPYQAFSYVQGEVLAVVDVKGKSDKEDDKEAWSDMRIVKAYKWTKKDSVAFAIYAAELVLDNYEKEYPDDKRPRKAIEAAKKVLFKDTKKNRDAAWSAARSAARSAESAAWSAAESAAESAARSAESAAESAARSAESAAWSAAWSAESAARSAAWSAARSAARSAVYKKLGKWMIDHIKEMEEL